MILDLACVVAITSLLSTTGPTIVFNCKSDNDLYAALVRSRVECPLFATPTEAIERAEPGSAVLVLADGYPDRQTQIDPGVFERATKKNLTLYVEYPEAVPGLSIAPPTKAIWERLVVSREGFGDLLPPMRILGLHDCRYVVTTASDPILVLARVAGFDTAVFGLPEERFPILFELPERKLIISTTKLSGFVSGRFAPAREWTSLWEQLLTRLDPGFKAVSLTITPLVRPSYGRDEPLPEDAERQVLRRTTEWYFNSRLLIHPSREAAVHDLLRQGKEEVILPSADVPVGDGSCGLLEGYASPIQHDGNQYQRLPLRSDCHAESAMCLALDWSLNQSARSKAVAENLLNYVFFTSEFCRGVRGDPKHPAFGLVAWGAVAPAWRVANYGDDDARVIKSAILAAACLESDRWSIPITRALLANLRTTGTLGFRGSRIDIPQLERLGWKHFRDAQTINFAPHYEAALWACYLWAYARTGDREFLDKAKAAIRMIMQAYPDRWLWQNDTERARMLLTLAWLVRVEDTGEHRAWLKRMAEDLLAHQDPCGAIPVRLGVRGSGHFLAPTRNEEYGTREVPLIQENGNPVSDQLYTTGFALLALHEAAAATGDSFYKQSEDSLAGFLCRIQIQSKQFAYLDGAWFRAFDYGRWDYWSGSGDIGWGAWCVEAGWGQAWATAALALRIKNTSMWEMTRKIDIARHLGPIRQEMAENDGGPWATGK